MSVDIPRLRQLAAGLHYGAGEALRIGDVEIMNAIPRLLDELEDCRASIARYAEMAADSQAHAQQLQAELEQERAGMAAELARVEEENPDVIAMIKRQPALVEASHAEKEVRRARAQGRREGVRLAADIVTMCASSVASTVEMLRALADEGE